MNLDIIAQDDIEGRDPGVMRIGGFNEVDPAAYVLARQFSEAAGLSKAAFTAAYRKAQFDRYDMQFGLSSIAKRYQLATLRLLISDIRREMRQ